VAALHGTTTSTAAVPSTATVPSTTAVPSTAAPAGTGDLPVPQDSPADPYGATPAVVHGTLELPTIGVAEPLHEGVTLTAINRGPSHWPGTAMPGQLGNVVVAGHRTTYTQPFHDLDLLGPGDPLVFTMADGSAWTYELTSTEIVGPDAMHVVDQSPEHTATLFACHPKGSAAQRIVAHFRLVGGGA
jgi:sortase A